MRPTSGPQGPDRCGRPTWENDDKAVHTGGNRLNSVASTADTAKYRNSRGGRLSWAALSRPVRARRAAEQAVTTRSGATAFGGGGAAEGTDRRDRHRRDPALLDVDETRELLSWPWLIAIAGSFAAVNLVSLIGQGGSVAPRPCSTRCSCSPTPRSCSSCCGSARTIPNPADWAIMVLPVLEGAIRFQLVGAIASWSALAIGYLGWSALNPGPASLIDLLQRLARRAPGRAAERLSREPPRRRDRGPPARARRSRAAEQRCSAPPRSAAAGARASTSTRCSTRCAPPSIQIGFTDPVGVRDRRSGVEQPARRPAGPVLAAGARHPARRSAHRRRGPGARRRRPGGVAAARRTRSRNRGLLAQDATAGRLRRCSSRYRSRSVTTVW